MARSFVKPITKKRHQLEGTGGKRRPKHPGRWLGSTVSMKATVRMILYGSCVTHTRTELQAVSPSVQACCTSGRHLVNVIVWMARVIMPKPENGTCRWTLCWLRYTIVIESPGSDYEQRVVQFVPDQTAPTHPAKSKQRVVERSRPYSTKPAAQQLSVRHADYKAVAARRTLGLQAHQGCRNTASAAGKRAVMPVDGIKSTIIGLHASGHCAHRHQV